MSLLTVLGGVSGVWLVSQAVQASMPTAHATSVGGVAGILAILGIGAVAGGLAVHHHYKNK